MPSAKDRRRWAASGGRASYSSLSPEARAEALRERSRRANEAKRLKYPPKPRREYVPATDWDGELNLPIPASAFSASDSDGEWESFGDDD